MAVIERVRLKKELQRQIIIQELNTLGFKEYENHNLEDLDYYTLRSILAAARVRAESDANRWF